MHQQKNFHISNESIKIFNNGLDSVENESANFSSKNYLKVKKSATRNFLKLLSLNAERFKKVKKKSANISDNKFPKSNVKRIPFGACNLQEDCHNLVLIKVGAMKWI